MQKTTDYKIVTKLHESASSLVYRVFADTEYRPVIFKVVKNDYPSPSELTRYKQEYEITRSLNIKGAVSAYELLPYQNSLAIAILGIILICLLGSSFDFFYESPLALAKYPVPVSQPFTKSDLLVRTNYTSEEETKFARQTFLALYNADCSVPPAKNRQMQQDLLYFVLIWFEYKTLSEIKLKKSNCVSYLTFIAVTKVMEKNTRNISIFWLALVCCMTLMLLVQSTTGVLAGNLNIPAPKLTFQLPANPSWSIRAAYNPATAFAQFAWQAFVALNWPANCNGVPLSDRSIGQSPISPRVWEFYPFPQNIFLPGGRDPRPLRSPVPLTCQTDNNLQIWDLRLTEDEGDPMSLLLADRQPLVDREGNYIVNEIRLNPVEANQIVQNRWYAVENLAEFNNSNNRFALACSNAKKDGLYKGKFPCTENKSVGAIEIKAAWKVLPNPILGETNPTCEISESRYYKNIRTFRITSDRSTNGSEIVTVPVGLVGFHISQKTSQQGWVWATFEQVDNAPDANGLPSAKNYTLYDRNCTRNCEPNTSYARKPYLWRREYPHAVTRSETGEIVEQIPSQITRLIPIPAIAKSFNTAWQEKLRQVVTDSVWQYYQLVGIQWLESPEAPYKPELKEIQLRQGNQPSMLANTTLEPYVQKGPPLYPFGNSCATCHAQATLSHPNAKTFADFSYLLNDAGDADRK